VKHVPLNNGKYALVDDQDALLVSSFTWTCLKTRGKEYAVTTVEDKTIYMHRLIMQPPDYLQVDHINGDGLDNRRTNLREATGSQNQGNTNKTSRSTYSRYKGVTWCKRNGKWYASITYQRKKRSLGYHTTEEGAARAYDAAAFAQWGPFAKLNLPDEQGQSRAA
jgi:hypothetical protein